ncbi:MAG: class I SAM-dependent methyltransferase [Planctomycetes bacterium]|nr:class I SAM-dependent methyltransferase [Planctomycetota bacterium]
MAETRPCRRTPPATGADAAAVRQANRTVYDRMPVEEYERNPSIFGTARQSALLDALADLAARTAGGDILDVGCGTGNVLRLARGLFRRRTGVDLGRGVLRAVRTRDPECLVALADGAKLPFPDRAFDCVTYYGVLHHLSDPFEPLQEAHRVLRPGGYLYTDHDLNYYFGRFWRIARQLRRAGRVPLGLEGLSEYQNHAHGGVHPGRIERILRGLGFAEVRITFRHTSNPRLSPSQRFVVRLTRLAARRIPLRSFYTHFSVLARK